MQLRRSIGHGWHSASSPVLTVDHAAACLWFFNRNASATKLTLKASRSWAHQLFGLRLQRRESVGWISGRSEERARLAYRDVKNAVLHSTLASPQNDKDVLCLRVCPRQPTIRRRFLPARRVARLDRFARQATCWSTCRCCERDVKLERSGRAALQRSDPCAILPIGHGRREMRCAPCSAPIAPVRKGSLRARPGRRCCGGWRSTGDRWR